jgi:ABC-type sugar transport system ATPase subunit
LSGDGAEVAGQFVPLAPALLTKATQAAGLEIGIRPEAIGLGSSGSGLAVEIGDVEHLGTRKIATCRLGEHEIKVVVPPEQPIASERGILKFNPAMTRLYADGRLVG